MIPSVRLNQGQNSLYRLNVDGQTGSGVISGKEFENVEILAKDMKATLNKASYLTFAFMLFFSIFLSKLFGGLGLAYALILSELFSFFLNNYVQI